MRENFSKLSSNLALPKFSTKMVITLKEILMMEEDTDKDYTIMLMEISLMETLSMIIE